MLINNIPTGCSGSSTLDATATDEDVMFGETYYGADGKSTGTFQPITLNLFSQLTEPTTYHGLWVKAAEGVVYKLAQMEDFLAEWNTNYVQTMPVAKRNFGCAVSGTKFYCIGGYTTTAVATVYIYDTVTNTWTIGTPMPLAKYNLGCVAANGKIYCIGGVTTGVVATNYIYDIATDSWTTGTAMTAAKSNFGCAIFNDKIYCIGGNNGTSAIATNYIYNIVSNSWVSGVNMTTAKQYFGCVANNGNVYCIGGTSGSALATNYIYNIEGNSWTSGTVMTLGKYGFGCVEYNGNIYCIGGYTTVGVTTNYIYNIAGNSWTTGTSINIAISYFGCILYNSRIYCIGGYYRSASVATTSLYSPSGGADTSMYDADTIILQHMNAYEPYTTNLIYTSFFVGGFSYSFTDAMVNTLNVDIYYGDGTQWIKFRSAV